MYSNEESWLKNRMTHHNAARPRHASSALCRHTAERAKYIPRFHIEIHRSRIRCHLLEDKFLITRYKLHLLHLDNKGCVDSILLISIH